MKFQLFISQACHINKGSKLGRDAKRRNKNSVETKKNVRIDHRGGKKEREEQFILAKLSLCGDAVPSDTIDLHFYTISVHLDDSSLYCTTLTAWSFDRILLKTYMKMKSRNPKRSARSIKCVFLRWYLINTFVSWTSERSESSLQWVHPKQMVLVKAHCSRSGKNLKVLQKNIICRNTEMLKHRIWCHYPEIKRHI